MLSGGVLGFVAFDDVSIRQFHDPRFRVFADHLCTHCAFAGLYFDVLHWFCLICGGYRPPTANKAAQPTGGNASLENSRLLRPWLALIVQLRSRRLPRIVRVTVQHLVNV